MLHGEEACVDYAKAVILNEALTWHLTPAGWLHLHLFPALYSEHGCACMALLTQLRPACRWGMSANQHTTPCNPISLYSPAP